MKKSHTVKISKRNERRICIRDSRDMEQRRIYLRRCSALLGGYASMLVCMAVVGVAAAALSLGSLPSGPSPTAARR